MNWLNAVVQGTLLGGLYALFAAGLSIIFGVMRQVNIAHGDLIVLSAYVAYVVIGLTGIDPLASIAIVTPLMALTGYLLQRVLFNKTLGSDILPPLLVSFGVSVIIQNGLLAYFSADSRRISAPAIEAASFTLAPGLSVGVLPLITFGIAICCLLCLQLMFYRTAFGRDLRATSDIAEMARTFGLDNAHVYGIAMAISLSLVAIAGVLIAIKTNFDPLAGSSRLLFGFEAVIIGGLGNLWGTFVGGIILAVAQSIGAELDPNWQLLAGHLVFLLTLAIKPQGLISKAHS